MKNTHKYYRQSIVQLLFAIIFFLYMATFFIDLHISSDQSWEIVRCLWLTAAVLNIIPALFPQVAISSEGLHFNILGFRIKTLAWADTSGFLQKKNIVFIFTPLEEGIKLSKVIPLYGLRRKNHLIAQLKEHSTEIPPDEAIQALRQSLALNEAGDMTVRNIELTENTINFSHIYSNDLSIPYENIRYIEFRPPVFHTGHHFIHYLDSTGQMKKHRVRIYPDRQHMHLLAALIKRVPQAGLDSNLLLHNGLFIDKVHTARKRRLSSRTAWTIIGAATFLILVLPVMAYVMKYEDASILSALNQGLGLVFALALLFALVFFPLLFFTKLIKKLLAGPRKTPK